MKIVAAILAGAACVIGISTLRTPPAPVPTGGRTIVVETDASGHPAALTGAALRVFADLPYAADHPRQCLDIYDPASPDPAPVLFFVHGGGWSTGDKNIYGHVGRYFALKGFCTVVVNHRLSPEVKHPQHARDVARALAWTATNVQRYGGDPAKLNLMGHSSGAHLTALVMSDPEYLKAVGMDETRVNRFVGISGVYSINLMVTLAGFGHVFDKKDHETASPLHYTTRRRTLLLYGEKDYVSMPRQASAFRDKITKAGGSCESFVAPGETHQSIIINACRDEKPHVQKILAFLQSP